MRGDISDLVLSLAVLIVSVILHENAHGWTALALGDRTAQAAGRLTLNPVRHIDPVGSVILPAVLFFSTGTMFGYAKPVPINPRSLRGKDRWGFAVVAIAGPVMNLLLAAIAGFWAARQGVLFLKGRVFVPPSQGIFGKVLVITFVLNVFLAAFNLVPIPPLDGSRLVRPFLGDDGRRVLDRIEPFGFVIILIAVVVFQEPFFRLVDLIRSALVHLLPV